MHYLLCLVRNFHSLVQFRVVKQVLIHTVDVKNKPFTLQQHKNTGAVLFFYNSDKTNIDVELKKFAQIQKKYGQRGISFISVMLTPADKQKALKLVSNSGLENCINLVSDDDEFLIGNYNIINGFKLVILDMENRVLYKNISMDNVDKALEHYLN